MFLWVLILGFWFRTEIYFDKNHNVWVIIKANGYLILDLCLIVNKTLSFIAWNLVLFDIYVIGFEFECSLLFFVFFIFFCLIYFCYKILCFFLVLILFRFKSLFWFSFGLNLGFRFSLWLNQYFRVNPVRSKPGQIL